MIVIGLTPLKVAEIGDFKVSIYSHCCTQVYQIYFNFNFKL